MSSSMNKGHLQRKKRETCEFFPGRIYTLKCVCVRVWDGSQSNDWSFVWFDLILTITHSRPEFFCTNHFYFLDLTDLSKNASIRSQLSSKYIQMSGLGVTDPCSWFLILDRLVSLVLHLVHLRVCYHHNHVGSAVAQNLATARLAEFQVTL